MDHADTATKSSMRLFLGFGAGLLSTLVFHQIALALLWAVGIAPFAPFNMGPTFPFGVPATLSLAFWGGVWGIVFAFVDRRFPAGGGYWIAAFLFGAILPTLVALLVVAPLKGAPVGGGLRPLLWLTAILINGVWGVGTGVFLRMFSGVGRRALG